MQNTLGAFHCIKQPPFVWQCTHCTAGMACAASTLRSQPLAGHRLATEAGVWHVQSDGMRQRRALGRSASHLARRRQQLVCGSAVERRQEQATSGATSEEGSTSVPPSDGLSNEVSSSAHHVPKFGEPGWRLFSRLSPSTLKHEPGTVLGAAALVSGTTVGAGILALPAVTAESGFAASSAALTACCLYSIVTGLLVAEVNINTLCELGAGRGVSISSMARRTLGDAGATAVSITYALLHYSLLVAYIAKAGEVVNQVTGIPLEVADAAFVALVGGFCFVGDPTTVDRTNSFLVAVFLASFLGLVGLAAADVQPELLTSANWQAVPNALPVIALAFVYQNVVPVITAQLEGDIVKIRQAVLFGVGLPWLMFLAWDAAILGSGSMAAAGSGDPLAVLRQSPSPVVGPLIDGFTFLAVGTSFIGFVLSLTEFASDAFQLPTGSRAVLPYLITLAPPLALAVLFPGVFFKALGFAGTYGVLVLFGLIPVAMAWSERYGGSTLSRIEIVPGGRPMLLAVAGTAAAVIGRELLKSSGVL